MKEHIPLMKPNSTAFAELWVNICLDSQRQHDRWVSDLRAQGVKAAHPDDGWVDRERDSVQFAYPQFDDGPQVGDVIVLGWPSEPVKNRWVEVTKIAESFLGCIHYYFKDSPKKGQAT